MIIYGENGGFTQEFLRENSMGPNPLRMLEELLTQQPISPGARVLDLGCGRGITSMYPFSYTHLPPGFFRQAVPFR